MKEILLMSLEQLCFSVLTISTYHVKRCYRIRNRAQSPIKASGFMILATDIRLQRYRILYNLTEQKHTHSHFAASKAGQAALLKASFRTGRLIWFLLLFLERKIP